MNTSRFERGAVLFNAGQYHEAHDEWEAEWKGLTESPEKDLLKGLIMASAALHHYARKEYAGTSKLLKRVLEVLANVKDVSADMDLEAFLSDISAFAQGFESSGEVAQDKFPKIRKPDAAQP